MMLLADRLLPPGLHRRHWCPQTPLATQVGGVGARDRPTPWQDHPGSVGSVPSHPGGRHWIFFGASLRARDPCLTREPRLRCGTVPGAGDTFPGGVQLGKNGAPTSIVLLRPVQNLFYREKNILLQWGAPLGGPPYDYRAPGWRLCGTERCLCCTKGGPSVAHRGSPPLYLEVYTIQ